MPAANVDHGAAEDSVVTRTRHVLSTDLDQALDRLASGKSQYIPAVYRFLIMVHSGEITKAARCSN